MGRFASLRFRPKIWHTLGTLKVGIREFREKLASYLLEIDVPVAITRRGDTIGYYIPARRKRSEAERAALKEAAAMENFLAQLPFTKRMAHVASSHQDRVRAHKKTSAGRRKSQKREPHRLLHD
jgi:PHD/YefM family antitoxin component YafN of YafNO toxin-antitoxin module